MIAFSSSTECYRNEPIIRLQNGGESFPYLHVEFVPQVLLPFLDTCQHRL